MVAALIMILGVGFIMAVCLFHFRKIHESIFETRLFHYSKGARTYYDRLDCQLYFTSKTNALLGVFFVKGESRAVMDDMQFKYFDINMKMILTGIISPWLLRCGPKWSCLRFKS